MSAAQRAPARGSVRHGGRRGPWALALGVLACGTPNPRVLQGEASAKLEPVRAAAGSSEADKMRALIDAVRSSGASFVQDGKTVDGPTAAAELERRVARMSVTTARQFVDRLGGADGGRGTDDTVTLPDGTKIPARDWYLARLGELEGAAGKTGEAQTLAARTAQPASLGILDALTIVERSSDTFVAPPRKLPGGKTKGKRKEYTAAEFAEMLRKKWEFLGADVRDLDTFVDEIASDSFSSMAPYLVVHADGREEEFRGWLMAQLDQRRVAIAKAGG